MSTLSIPLPDSMHEKIRELAEKEGVSMNQLGEKILNFLERNWYCLLTLETIYSLCYTTNSYYGHSRECGNLNIARQSAIDSCKAIRFRACLWRQAGIRCKMTNRHIQRVFLYRTHVKINGEPAGVLWFPQDDSLSAVVWEKHFLTKSCWSREFGRSICTGLGFCLYPVFR